MLFTAFVAASGQQYKPSEICLLTDHKPVPRGSCSFIASSLKLLAADMKGASQEDILQAFTRLIHKRSWSFKANHVIPCLNRNYACEMGYSFFMPASPMLTIANEGVHFPEMMSEVTFLLLLCVVATLCQ
jgi:hypothetical protein